MSSHVLRRQCYLRFPIVTGTVSVPGTAQQELRPPERGRRRRLEPPRGRDEAGASSRGARGRHPHPTLSPRERGKSVRFADAARVKSWRPPLFPLPWGEGRVRVPSLVPGGSGSRRGTSRGSQRRGCHELCVVCRERKRALRGESRVVYSGLVKSRFTAEHAENAEKSSHERTRMDTKRSREFPPALRCLSFRVHPCPFVATLVLFSLCLGVLAVSPLFSASSLRPLRSPR
jgi:hypothetical protein